MVDVRGGNPQPPQLLTPAQRQQQKRDEQQHDADQDREDYHARLVVVSTPAIRHITATGRKRVLLNRFQHSARRGLIVSGAAGTGKTTAITQLGKNFEQLTRRRQPFLAEMLPVLYITVPPAATPKMLATELARFIGLPLPSRYSQVEVTNQVCDLLCKHSTQLILVDEIHNLDIGTRVGAESSDQIKYLSERIPATFVLAGVDVDGSGLFAGRRGGQIASRYTLIQTLAFPRRTESHRHDWQALIATLEQSLRLYAHRQGTLVALDGYLHERTKGMIGSLSHLIREAAIDAIITGKEKITKADMDRIQLDQSAQDQHRQQHRHRSSARTG